MTNYVQSVGRHSKSHSNNACKLDLGIYLGVLLSGDNMSNIYRRKKQPLGIMPTVVENNHQYFYGVNNNQ